jgi:hypothetical protein
MQTDDLENQVSNHTLLLQYQYYPAQTNYRQFTLPVRENDNCSKEVVKGGLLSKLPYSSSSERATDQVIITSDSILSFNMVSNQSHQNGHSHQQPMDKVITSPIALPVFKAPGQIYTNGHSHQQPMDKVITSPIALPVFKAPAKTGTNGHSNGRVYSNGLLYKNLSSRSIIETVPPATMGVNHSVSWLYDLETHRLSVATATMQHRTTFGDILHFLGYMVGASTIVSLYMIIPLMILINVILPDTWNKLLIVLGIFALVEFVICIILAKTTPKRKRKKENVLVQP